MQFDDWVTNFNSLYYCRIYPQNWSQYCIAGGWEGIYSGGAPPKGGNAIFTERTLTMDKTISPKKTAVTMLNPSGTILKKTTTLNPTALNLNANASSVSGELMSMKKSGLNQTILKNTLNQMKSTNMDEMLPSKATTLAKNNTILLNNNSNNLKKSQTLKEPESHSKEFLKRIILNDSEDRWFLNPQYKLEIKYQTKIIITLLQEDEKLSKKLYQKCNFLIIISKSKHSRIWDIKEDHIIKKAVEFEEYIKI
jgi:hypothetical protein